MTFQCSIKWSGKDFDLEMDNSKTVLDFKVALFALTNVEPKSQKILGFKVGSRLAPDDTPLSQLAVKPGQKVMMMGAPETAKLVGPPEDLAEVADDFELGEEVAVSVTHDPVNHAKIAQRLKSVKVKALNPPRPGKKLLVLDIDYTLFDHRSTVETAAELMRPYLHEFLGQVYPFYDIIIWSATSLQWIELKMKELGVASNPAYSLVAFVDYDSCISLSAPGYGLTTCKPLQVIWDRDEYKSFYGPENTIMFDDISHNFLMNPQNGLKIKAFRQAPLNRATDNELLRLTEYLLLIKDLPSFVFLNHKKWERYVEQNRRL